MRTDVITARASVGGLNLYYEIRGSGPLVVLLHGAILIDTGPLADVLAQDHLVVTPHLQGRGHTPDIDRPFDYDSMADCVIALLQHLNVERVDVVGQSMGAGVALRVALRHPDRVQRLVLTSTTLSSDGWHPKVRAELAAMETDAAQLAQRIEESGLDVQYPEVDWVQLFQKTGQFQQRHFDIVTAVSESTVSALLVFADEDAVTPSHMLEFWAALGGGVGEGGLTGPERSASQLAIVPGANHSTIAESQTYVDIVAGYLSPDDRALHQT